MLSYEFKSYVISSFHDVMSFEIFVLFEINITSVLLVGSIVRSFYWFVNGALEILILDTYACSQHSH